MENLLYFAYGADMRAQAMALVIGREAEGTRARLKGFRLAFTAFAQEWGGGVADLVRDEEGEVEGVVYELKGAEALRVELAEGLSEGLYRRRRVRVELESGEEADAIANEVASKRAHVPPSAAYLDAMVSGATEQGLSEGYVDFLLQLYPDEATRHAAAPSDEE